ncbi:MAG: GDSL-type esterase/lipase family protein [Pseudomonadota bacterium]
MNPTPATRSTEPGPPRRRWGKTRGALLFLAALVLASAGAEAFLQATGLADRGFSFFIRHMDRDVSFGGYVSDPDLLWRIRPGAEIFIELPGRPSFHARSNSHGLRGPDFPTEKPPGEKRILFLGDSITFGLFLADEDSLPARVQAILAETGHSEWRAVNGAVTGYTSQQGLLYLEKEGLSLTPDLVVACFGANDASFRLLSDRQCRSLTRPGSLARRFALAGLVEKARARQAMARREEDVNWVLRVGPLEFFENMARMARISQEAGALALFLATPGRHPAFPGQPPVWEAVTSPQTRRAALDSGAGFLPLTGLRATDPEDNSALFYDSCHMTGRGNDLAARRVVDWMEENGLLDGRD